MLKRIRQVGEAVGVLIPSVADASVAAEEHRQALIAAQAALEKSQDELQAAHDRCADTSDITRLEAAVAAAKVEASRAEGRYRGAEKRLAAARKAEADQEKAAALVKLDESLTKRAGHAARIEALMIEIAAEVRGYDGEDVALAEAARAGVASRVPHIDGRAVVQGALRKAGVVPGPYNPLGAVEIDAMARGAILAVAP